MHCLCLLFCTLKHIYLHTLHYWLCTRLLKRQLLHVADDDLPKKELLPNFSKAYFLYSFSFHVNAIRSVV